MTLAQILDQRYEVLGEAGRGGMGIVYKARDRETGEIVAVKVLKPEISGRAEVVERFKNELRLARSVTHRHACRIHELMRFGNTVAISMEYVDGHSLRWVLRRFGGVPFRRGLEWIQEICAALSEAHAQGIIHRDLKPENIMIDDEGHAKVMDFGLALSQESSGYARSDRSGTPRYMSPEQAAGGTIDARTDVYALGLIMREMFTGRQPSQWSDDGEDTSSPGSSTPRSLEPLVPVFLDRVIRQCLRRDPRKRFVSASELAKALTIGELNEFESEITTMPQHLTRGRRLDVALIVLGALGLAAFLWASQTTIPESRIRLQWTPRMFIQQAIEELRRRGWQDPREPHLAVSQNRELYHYLLERKGAREALDRYGESRPYRFDVHFRGSDAESNPGGVFYDHAGNIYNFWLPVEEVVPNNVDAPRDSALVLAAAEVERSLGAPIAALNMESEARLSVKGRHGHSFGWVRPDSSGFDHWYSASVYDRATAMSQWTDFPEMFSPPASKSYTLWWITLCLAVIIGLFFGRRAHSLLRRESITVLLLAGAPLAVVLTMQQVDEWSTRVLVAIITTVFFGGYLIMALPTIHYLARRNWPHRTLGLMRLAELHPDPAATGLAVVRGFAAGLAYLGLAEGLRWIGLMRGWAVPNLAADITSICAGAVPFGHVVEAGAVAVIVALIFALVIGLVSRWTRSAPMLLLLAGVLLVGLANPSDWFGRGSAFLAGVAALWLFSAFDLTTLIAAVFSWGLWLNGTAALRALEDVGNGQIMFGFLCWGALLVWGMFTAYQPLWAGIQRNLRAKLD